MLAMPHIKSLPQLYIIIFDEVKHSNTDFKTFVEYFSLSNGNTDRQAITLCQAGLPGWSCLTGRFCPHPLHQEFAPG